MPSTHLTPAKVHARLQLPGVVVSEFSQPPSTIPKHYHQSAILSVVLRGHARERVGHTDCELSPYAVVFKPSGESHTHEYGAKGTSVLAIELDVKVATRWMGVNAERVYHASALSSPAAVARLRAELKQRDDLSSIAIQSAFFELLTVLIRQSRRQAPDKSIATRARDYIHQSSFRRLQLNQLASQLGVSARELDVTFRREYACSISSYVRQQRFARALEVIVQTEIPLSQIAHDFAYCDQAHMTRDITQRIGLAPSALRRRNQTEKIQIGDLIQDKGIGRVEF